MGHCLSECPVVVSDLLENEEDRPMPEELSKFRKAMLSHGTNVQRVVALDAF